MDVPLIIVAPMKPRILIVEDEPGIADTVRYALKTEGFEPHWFATGEEALAKLASIDPALVLLDIGLPDISGTELLKRLRDISDVPVVFLTARSDEIDRVLGLELGADDYVPKPFSPRELVARVRTILRRTQRAPAAPPAAAPMPFAVDAERHQIRYYGRALELSRYEYCLLKTLIARPGRVFSRDELLERVWDDPGESLDRTVDAHVKTLRAKLKAVAPALDPIRTLRGTGYAWAEDLPAAP
jgi:two-component system, OmpR family, catabolic regulation response regulator CreB